jgi:hypothetical protein
MLDQQHIVVDLRQPLGERPGSGLVLETALERVERIFARPVRLLSE